MSDQYIGEIRMAGFGVVPQGWALCNGQTLPINTYQALFSILGTQYGGNGVTTFALPNLQGRVPLSQGTGYYGSYQVGDLGGEVTHTLTVNEMPLHNHLANAQSTAATSASPSGTVWAAAAAPVYAPTPNAAMAAGAVVSSGNGQPHENQPPYLVVSFIIALEGIFPSRS